MTVQALTVAESYLGDLKPGQVCKLIGSDAVWLVTEQTWGNEVRIVSADGTVFGYRPGTKVIALPGKLVYKPG